MEAFSLNDHKGVSDEPKWGQNQLKHQTANGPFQVRDLAVLVICDTTVTFSQT